MCRDVQGRNSSDMEEQQGHKRTSNESNLNTSTYSTTTLNIEEQSSASNKASSSNTERIGSDADSSVQTESHSSISHCEKKRKLTKQSKIFCSSVPIMTAARAEKVS